MQLTLTQLSGMVPCSYGDATIWIQPLNNAMHEWGIDSPIRIAAFIAQISHESARLRRLEENLNYSVQGLANTWPSRFAVNSRARPLVPNEAARRIGRVDGVQSCNQEALANLVYARESLGNTMPGDGWKYRGRGPKQITGKFNYTACGQALGLNLVDFPELLLNVTYGSRAAAWYWVSHGCNELIDRGDYAGVTMAINGGMIGHEDGNVTGLDDRVELFVNARNVLGIA